MSLSKKQASALLSLVLLVGIAMFFLGPIVFNEESNDSNPENPVEEDDQGQIENVNFEGVTVLPDGNAIVFPNVIVDNHRNRLINNSVELDYRTPSTDVNIKKSGSRILVVDDGDLRTTRQYTDGVLNYGSTEVSGETSYSAERDSISSSEYNKGSLFRSILTDLGVRSVTETSDGISLKLTASSDFNNMNTVIPDYEQINEADADIEISNTGIITGMKLQLIGPDLFGVPQSSTYYYNITQTQGVSVDTPTWVSSVKNQVSIVESESDLDNDWIKLQHKGLAKIDSSSTISILTSSGESANLNLSQPVGSGDEIYISPESGGWNAYVNEEPTAERNLDSDSDVIVSISNEQNGEIIEYYGETITVGS